VYTIVNALINKGEQCIQIVIKNRKCIQLKILQTLINKGKTSHWLVVCKHSLSCFLFFVKIKNILKFLVLKNSTKNNRKELKI